MNPNTDVRHRLVRHRLVPGAATCLVLASSLGLSACGNSSSSTSSAATHTSVSASAPTGSSTPSGSTTPSASNSAAKRTPAQLAQAIGRTRVGGAAVPAAAISPSGQAQTFTSLNSLRQEMVSSATFTPAECGEQLLQAMRGPSTTSPSNAAVVLDKNANSVLVAANDVADPWAGDAASKCTSYTEKDKATKTQSAMTSKGSIVVSPLQVDGLTDTHTVALKASQDGSVIRVASGRLGSTWLQVATQNSKIDPAATLKDLAAQVQKLG